jgi:cell division protein FtsL
MPSRAVIYTEVATIKMTHAQRQLINQRAKLCGVRASVWMRSILMQAAQSAARQSSEGYLRIREPDGVTT